MRKAYKKAHIEKVNLLAEQRYLNEKIVLDIKVGDVVLGGKFKNKRIVVKKIDKNEKGDITINGKPLLRFRIIDDKDKKKDK